MVIELFNNKNKTNMNCSLNLAQALKRIKRDYLEVINDPCPGIGFVRKDVNDDFTYLVNIKILHGIYEEILFQLEMYVPKTYRMDPPNMLILPDQPFGHEHFI